MAHALLDNLDSGATIDRHLADQLIIFAALALGASEFRIPQATDHVYTHIWLVETLLGAAARVEGKCLRIQEIGYEPPP